MKIIKKIIAGFYLNLLILPLTALAQVPSNLIDDAAGINGAGYPAGAGGPNTIPQTIGTLISIVLSFVGAIFFIYIVISGIQWMTAGGEEEKVEKAKTRIMNAIVGLAITVAAFFITWFISNTLGAA